MCSLLVQYNEIKWPMQILTTSQIIPVDSEIKYLYIFTAQHVSSLLNKR